MMWHVRRSGRPNKIIQTDKPVALFASMIALFYDDAFLAKGYDGRLKPNSPNCGMCRDSPNCGMCRASQVKLSR